MESVTPEEDFFEMFNWEVYFQQINALKCSEKEWVAAYKKALKDIKL